MIRDRTIEFNIPVVMAILDKCEPVPDGWHLAYEDDNVVIVFRPKGANDAKSRTEPRAGEMFSSDLLSRRSRVC